MFLPSAPACPGQSAPTGVQPPARGGCCVRVREIEQPLAGGPAAPRSPRKCDRGREGQTAPARPSIIFHRERLPSSRSLMSRAILARGSGGATPGQRRPSPFVIAFLRTWRVRVLENRRVPLPGGLLPPRSPRKYDGGRDGQSAPGAKMEKANELRLHPEN